MPFNNHITKPIHWIAAAAISLLSTNGLQAVDPADWAFMESDEEFLTEYTTLDVVSEYGRAIATYEDYVLISAWKDYYDTKNEVGSVYVYKAAQVYNATDDRYETQWFAESYDSASLTYNYLSIEPTKAYSRFGSAVAIDRVSNNEIWAVVGARGYDNTGVGMGAIESFRLNSSDEWERISAAFMDSDSANGTEWYGEALAGVCPI